MRRARHGCIWLSLWLAQGCASVPAGTLPMDASRGQCPPAVNSLCPIGQEHCVVAGVVGGCPYVQCVAKGTCPSP